MKAPGFGDRRKAMLGDIAVLTGGTFFSEDLGRNLEDIDIKELGQAQRRSSSTRTATDDHQGRRQEDGHRRPRPTQIRTQIERSTSDYDREKLQERLAKLTGGVAIINVGAATETAMKERKDRVEDALNATRAAAKEGYVPGGGVACIRGRSRRCRTPARRPRATRRSASTSWPRALEAPGVADRATTPAIDGDLVVEKIKRGKGGFGLNAATGEYEDLVKAGIIDPALVVRTALQHAASVAGLMLTTDVIITELKDDDEPVEEAVG